MPTNKEKGEAASNDNSIAKTETEAPETSQSIDLAQARQMLGNLSRETVDKLSLELTETLHQVTLGLDDKIKVSKIFDRGDSFKVIDATTLTEYLDKRTGEISSKHIFVLEFPQGDVQVIMQSDAQPRARLVKLFSTARALGARAEAGPYKMEKKEVGQPQPAFIFEKQPGFQARAF